MDPSITTVLSALWFLTPISVQAILLFRVVAAYPPRFLTWNQRLIIYIPFFVLLVARLINASICVAKIAEGVHTLANTFLASQLEWDLPYPKVEWFLQLIYDTYVSGSYPASQYKYAYGYGLAMPPVCFFHVFGRAS